jgi:formyl-CoA transferase
MEKWGLSYETLAKENPRLIMARVSGFGQTGPYARRPGISIGDSLAAMHAAMGVLMALHHREKTGRGQVIDAALYESVLAVMENLVTEYDLTGYVRERSGSILPGIAPSNAYPCANGEMILIGGNGDTVYGRLTEAMGRPELATDPRFKDHASRGQNQFELDAIIAEWTSEHTLSDLLALLEDKGVPASRVYRAPDMLEDPQYAARESIVETDHPVFGRIKMQNAFPKLSETPGRVRWPGPALGEHTEAVLKERAACSEAELAALRAKGII